MVNFLKGLDLIVLNRALNQIKIGVKVKLVFRFLV